ncbi:MAG: hypothetical protein CML16_18090 [Pusillimonas sp.]|nr:hypothetical protein [Pusillimonas sp.]|tara:strand:- start:5262 stop:5951 length:690 start_codon:yes stop_codon:yes gene_type:complete
MIEQENNRRAIEAIAIGLKELKDSTIFVGGAVVSLYADDPLTSDIRATEDIDLTIKVKHFSEFVLLNEKLLSQKFNPDPKSKSIVRYIYNGIPVDVIPNGAEIAVTGTNKWYSYGYNDIRKIRVNSQEIQIFSSAVFIATKFEAFNSRGKDYRTSHDIEDILNVLQNSSVIVNEISKAHKDVQAFIKQELSRMISLPSSEEILSANIDRLLLTEALPMLKATIKQIIED